MSTPTLTRDNLFNEAIWEHDKVLNARRERETSRLQAALKGVFGTDFGVDTDFLGITHKGTRYHIRAYDNGASSKARLAVYKVDPATGFEKHTDQDGVIVHNAFSDLSELGAILYRLIDTTEDK